MPVPGSDRLRYQFYRCINCKRLLTKLEILRRWQEAELHPEKGHPGTCACGGGRVQVTNMTPEEMEQLVNTKQKLRYFLLRKRDHHTRVVELWRHEVLSARWQWWLGWLLPRWKRVR